MARKMKAGDTWPPLKGEAADETGAPVNLSGAASMEVVITNGTDSIGGVATAIWPPEADVDGDHQWNWQHTFAVGATDGLEGDFSVELKVTWAAGELQTFPNTGHETLSFEAA